MFDSIDLINLSWFSIFLAFFILEFFDSTSSFFQKFCQLIEVVTCFNLERPSPTKNRLK